MWPLKQHLYLPFTFYGQMLVTKKLVTQSCLSAWNSGRGNGDPAGKCSWWDFNFSLQWLWEGGFWGQLATSAIHSFGLGVVELVIESLWF